MTMEFVVIERFVKRNNFNELFAIYVKFIFQLSIFGAGKRSFFIYIKICSCVTKFINVSHKILFAKIISSTKRGRFE